MTAIQKHAHSVYARGALPWSVFINQIMCASHKKWKTVSRPNSGSPAKLQAAKQATENDVLNCIANHGPIGTFGICERLGLSKSAVHRHSKELSSRGAIRQEKNATGAYVFSRVTS